VKEAVCFEGPVDMFIGKDKFAFRIVVNNDVVLVIERMEDTSPQLFRLVLAGFGNASPEFEAEGGV
jgi:hypothetical protein